MNAITEKVGLGHGCHLALRTGKCGAGQLVDDETMVMYLRRFGVKEQIESLPLRLPKPNARAGPLCQKPATKDAPSASLEPIAPTHVKRKSGKRTICCALHPSASKPAGMHVSAMPLSEKEKRPRMIHSQLAECCMPLLEPFVGTSLHESIRGDLLPALPMAHLSPSIFFIAEKAS